MSRLVLAVVALVATLGAGQSRALQENTVDFVRDVAPIIAERCSACHHEGGPAPFSLLTYEDVSSRAAEILSAVRTRTMPPWKPEPGFGGPFVGEKRLSLAEVSTFERWVDAGVPRGEDGPAPMHSHDGWRLGEPDLVVTLPMPYLLEAGGPDVFRNFAIAVPVERTRFVKGIEFLPDNMLVTHHANMRVDPTQNSARLDAHDEAPGYEGITASTAVFPSGHFLGWTPGQAPPFLPEGLSWRLEPGSTLVVETHLVPAATSLPVGFRVGFYFTDIPPRTVPVMLRLGRQNIDIPAGESRYVVRDSYTLPSAVDLLSVQPHAHYLATEVRAYAVLPGGLREWLLYIRSWDFHTQDLYRYQTPVHLPAGSTVHMEYRYDNSVANPAQRGRDPVRVRWGQYTSDEMGDLWLQVMPSPQADHRALLQTIRSKELAEDIVGYRNLLARTPDDVRIMASLADALHRSGRHAEALVYLREHVRREPESAHAHYNLGALLVSFGHLAEAEGEFERAVLLDPTAVAAWNALGAMTLERGHDPRIALERLLRAEELDPSYAKVYNNLGIAYARLGRVNDAVTAYRSAVARVPDDAVFRSNLAVALAQSGAYADAVREARLAHDLALQDPSFAVHLGWLLATVPDDGIRNPREALALTSGAVGRGGGDPSALEALAAAQAAVGEFSNATANARRSIEGYVRLGLEREADAVRLQLQLYLAKKPVILRGPTEFQSELSDR